MGKHIGTYKCTECGIDVLRHSCKVVKSGRVYCGIECRSKGMTKPDHVCIDCGTKLASRRNIRCRSCNSKWMVGENTHAYKERVSVICDQCGKEVERRPNDISLHNFCDQKCMGLWKSENLKGEKASSWKGGITALSKQFRILIEYRRWRDAVLKRDDYTCQNCGAEDHLETHHIVEFSELIKKYNVESVEQAKNTPELWDVSNGQTLCVHCHAEEHPDMRKLFKLRIA